MTDEKQQPDNENGWVMPEPVFRSSKGYDPRKGIDGPEEDIPTDVADKDLDEADTGELPTADEKQHVRPKTRAKKKGGCLSTVAFFVGIICLSLAIILGALLYFLYFYVPPEGGTF
ncbi:MAG: hypothetical protein IPM50_08090 [Acidobacteriota bacterium]|nr:MAG: hypothetical protein IPM50_08090 [Acidobacteriota bacterium]